MIQHSTLMLGGLQADVVRKNIKHVHLCVYPPDGQVRISAPLTMTLETIRVYAITKLEWIKSQQRKLRAQNRETPREYINRESHYLWGKRYLLRIIEGDDASSVKLRHNSIELHVRPGSDAGKKHALLESWYRENIRAEIPVLLAKWQPPLGVRPSRVLVQRMKTKWGSCNPDSGIVRLNTDLARKPRACLEYIFVHELVHLLERSHNTRFQSLMDKTMPHWRQVRHELNHLPVRHEKWEY